MQEPSKSSLISKLLVVVRKELDEARERGKSSQEEKALRDRMNILKFMRQGVLFQGGGKRGIEQDWKSRGDTGYVQPWGGFSPGVSARILPPPTKC